MNMKKLTVLVFYLLVAAGISFAQDEATITIENQAVNGTDFSFDIYLHASGSTSNVYLGNADFILTYNNGNFDNPTIEKEGTLPGFCSFIPTDQSGSNVFVTQTTYFINTSPTLSGNEIIINLNGPSPGNQNDFDASVANIDVQASTHRLGRFTISGLNDPTGTAGLMWKTTGSGAITQVFTLKNMPPFTSSLLDITAENPTDAPLPVELLHFSGKEIDHQQVALNWNTSSEKDNSHFVIERSADGQRFDAIGVVAGKGTSSVLQQYDYIDEQPLTLGYYRLKQVDFDGSFHFSNIISITLKSAQDVKLIVYPSTTEREVTIRFNTFASPRSLLRIVNSQGQPVFEEMVDTSQELEYRVMDLAGYEPGLYHVSLTDGTQFAIAKFVVTKL